MQQPTLADIPNDVLCDVILPYLGNETLFAFLYQNRLLHQTVLSLAEQRSNNILKSFVQNTNYLECIQTIREASANAQLETKHGDSNFEVEYRGESDGHVRYIVLPKTEHDLSTTHLIPHQVLLRINPNLDQQLLVTLMKDVVQPAVDVDWAIHVSKHLYDWLPVAYHGIFNEEFDDDEDDYDEYYKHYEIEQDYLMKYGIDPKETDSDIKPRHNTDELRRIIMLVCCRRDSPFWGRMAFLAIDIDGSARLYIPHKGAKPFTLGSFTMQNLKIQACMLDLDFYQSPDYKWIRGKIVPVKPTAPVHRYNAKYGQLVRDAFDLQSRCHMEFEHLNIVELQEMCGCQECIHREEQQ